MYEIKGAFTKKEYYWISLWKTRMFFGVIAIVSILPLVTTFGWENIFHLDFIVSTGLFLLYKWIQYFTIIALPVLIFLLLDAFLKRDAFLGTVKYVFEEEGIIYRTQISQRKILWAEVKGIEEKRFFWTILLRNTERSHIPYRFFESNQQKQQVLSFVKERGGVKK